MCVARKVVWDEEGLGCPGGVRIQRLTSKEPEDEGGYI